MNEKQSLELVILTKSSKNGGFCVAGINTDNGEWIRLVSSDLRSHGALFPKHMRFENGSYCEPLDVVTVPIIKRSPGKYQPENVLINEDIRWEKVGRYTIQDVLKLHSPENHSSILGNGSHKVTEKEISSVAHSLVLVEVKELSIYENEYGKKKVRFSYNSKPYSNISITDSSYYSQPATNMDKALLIISLPDTSYTRVDEDGYFKDLGYFKFVAKIFQL